MDNDENEIKIEYYETNENDPLREEVFDRPENQICAQDLLGSVQNKFYADDQRLYINNSVEIEGNDLNTHQNYITWFKSKDTDGKLICKYCELKYSTVQTLRHHVSTRHPEEAKNLRRLIINNKRNCRHICHVCKKRFKNLSELISHVNSDHSMELVKTSCNHCNATFNNFEELREHIGMNHQRGDKVIYTCTICGYRTLKRSHFNQHEKIHKQIKTMFCQHCDYKTSYLPNLRIHQRLHTNEKPYSCEFKGCSYRSVAKSALRSHQLKHYPDENMLFCEKCSYSTVYKQSLLKHLDSHKRNFIRQKVI